MTGLRYRFKGTVCSGDVDTSFGDSILNEYILESVMEDLGVSDYLITLNGDDSVLSIPVDHVQVIPLIPSQMRKYNMETKVGRVSTKLECIEFCRTFVHVDDDGNAISVIDPARLERIWGMTYRTREMTREQFMEAMNYAQRCIYSRLSIYRDQFVLTDANPKMLRRLAHIEPTLAAMVGTTKQKVPHTTASPMIRPPNLCRRKHVASTHTTHKYIGQVCLHVD